MKQANPDTLRLARTRHATDLPGELTITPALARLMQAAMLFDDDFVTGAAKEFEKMVHERPDLLRQG